MSRLIEREGLLARLVEAWQDGGRLLLVGGEAGVGKTTLVQAFTSGVAGRVLLGACERLVTAAPLGPLADVAGQIGGVLAREDEALGDHPLRRLLGELASVAAVERVAVAPLSLEAVRELASSSSTRTRRRSPTR
jgi:predicted ATPase